MRRILCMGIVLLIMCLSGCSSDNVGNSVERTEEMSGLEISHTNMNGELTEQQLQILQDCGLSDSQIQEIQEKGMTASQKSFVDVAELVLGRLREKYGVIFSIVGGSIPDLLASDYTFTACAVEGEYAFIPFEATYGADAEGKAVCREGYFAVIKNQEMQEYLQSIADEEGIEIRVITQLLGEVGDTYTKDSSLEDMKGKDTGIEVEIYGLVIAEVDEAGFMDMCERLAARYKDTGYRMGYDIYRLLDREESSGINTYADLKRIYPQGMCEGEVYDIRYHEYIIPMVE